MRKNKWILSVLIVGLLLCGIGGGIMFVEFSGMDYAGEYVFQTESPKTETIQLSLEECPEGPVYVDCFVHGLYPLENRVVVDETMEEGVVQIDTTYDPEAVYPSMYVSDMQWNVEEPRGRLSLGYYAINDDLNVFFQMKDRILEDLKNSTLRSYRTVDVMDLTITAGPKTAQRLVFN